MSHFEELRAKQREEHLQFHQKLIHELEKSQDNRFKCYQSFFIAYS
jgi:hypothetical protein